MKMINYLIKIEYDGTNFVGWQSQRNGTSVQDIIEKALKKIMHTLHYHVQHVSI